MRYHLVILVMFGFIEPCVKESDPLMKGRVKELRINSAQAIGTLLARFRLLWPMNCVPPTALQYCTVAMFTLLENLDKEQNKQAFMEAFIVLRALARQWQLGKGIIRLIQLTCKKKEVTLPEEAQDFFRDFEAELWKAGESGRFKSLYPNFSVAVNQEQGPGRHTDEAELDRILESWDKLDLSEQISKQTTKQTSEQTTEQTSEQTTEQTSEQTTEQTSEQTTEQTSEQTTEQGTETEDTSNDSNDSGNRSRKHEV